MHRVAERHFRSQLFTGIFVLMILTSCGGASEPPQTITAVPPKPATQPASTPTVDPKAQFAELQKKAQQGSPVAQFELGEFYEASKENDSFKWENTVKWYKKSADQGYAPAQAALGVFYTTGDGGLTVSNAEAVRLFQKSAAQGCAEGQYQLADMYADGWEGHPPKYSEAIKWYEKACAQKHPRAFRKLAALYASGHGGAKSHEKAADLYRKGAEQGDSESQYQLAQCYLKGDGVPKDPAKAMDWCKKSADQKYFLADELMGLIYEKGLGIPEDREHAIAWYQKAADLNDEHAKERAEALRTGIEPIKPSGNLGFTLTDFKTLFAKATKKAGLNLKIAKSEVDSSRAFTVNFNDESFMSGMLEPDSDAIIGLHVAGDGPPFMNIVATLIAMSVLPDPDAQKYTQVFNTFIQSENSQMQEGETQLNGLRYTLHNLGNGYDFVIANKAREEAEQAERNK
ncbi:MAG: sel1 repeat family protein [Candidatus Obscuribacterales bacterium]|nr:sel1 repeat family protein [Candidatus Obscuribacterales bacterium]